MRNLPKIMVLSIVLLGCTNLFAQPQDLQVTVSQFKEIDLNHDSYLLPGEMQAYQAKTFQELDKDKSNELSSGELEADQTDMHKLADKDQDGKATSTESALKFNEYFEQMDKDQDGKISEAEYTDYWKLIYKF